MKNKKAKLNKTANKTKQMFMKQKHYIKMFMKVNITQNTKNKNKHKKHF